MSANRTKPSDDPARKGSRTQATPANIEQPRTTYDVARAAGVSTASVSGVVNGPPAPRRETRNRVLQAVGPARADADGGLQCD